MMQNHYVISSKYHFWTRNLPNWTKTLTSVTSGLSLDSINQETHKGKYMDDNGTYLGNIYGIYKECITNISIDIYDIK